MGCIIHCHIHKLCGVICYFVNFTEVLLSIMHCGGTNILIIMLRISSKIMNPVLKWNAYSASTFVLCLWPMVHFGRLPALSLDDLWLEVIEHFFCVQSAWSSWLWAFWIAFRAKLMMQIDQRIKQRLLLNPCSGFGRFFHEFMFLDPKAVRIFRHFRNFGRIFSGTIFLNKTFRISMKCWPSLKSLFFRSMDIVCAGHAGTLSGGARLFAGVCWELQWLLAAEDVFFAAICVRNVIFDVLVKVHGFSIFYFYFIFDKIILYIIRMSFWLSYIFRTCFAH